MVLYILHADSRISYINSVFNFSGVDFVVKIPFLPW